MEHTFGDLLDRVQRLTGAETDDAFKVAKALWDENGDAVPTPAQIAAKARELGVDVKAPDAGDRPTGMNEPSVADAMKDMTDEEKLHVQVVRNLEKINCSMDPAEVLTEVYMVEPRVLHVQTPKLGRAPDEAYKYFAKELEDLPEEMIAALVKIDLVDGKATFWLRDEANNVDRPIGPIDLTRYEDDHALSQAFNEAFRRLPLVFAADMN